MLLALISIGGCSNPNSDPGTAPGTPKVSLEQAEEVAQKEYGLTKSETINLRVLTESERKNLNEEQLQLTPVYYVVTGLIENVKVTVYISSNEIKHHFIISDNPE